MLFLENKYIIYVALEGQICSKIYFTNYTQYSNETFFGQSTG